MVEDGKKEHLGNRFIKRFDLQCMYGCRGAMRIQLPGFSMRFDGTFPLIGREREQWVVLASQCYGPVLLCTDQELFPTGATHAEYAFMAL